jgi:hypothetical protein
VNGGRDFVDEREQCIVTKYEVMSIWVGYL